VLFPTIKNFSPEKMSHSLFSNQVFIQHHQEGSHRHAPQITFRDILSPKNLIRNAAKSSEDAITKIKTLIICTYICDWNWFAAELALCPFITPQTEVIVIINWLPETCNTEDPIIDPKFSGVFSEGVRQISIGIPGTKIERKITVIHPALVGGLMHVKLTLVQFASTAENHQETIFTRVVIGSANLTLDDWCNLRQAFFVAEGQLLLRENSKDADETKSKTNSNFGFEVEEVLLWLSLPKEIIQNQLRLSTHSWPTVPEKTKLIFSVPSTLQLSLDKVFQNRQQQEPKENDDDEKEEEEERELIPPIEIISASSPATRRRQTRGMLNAHDHREEFYNKEFLPIVFELNGNYYNNSSPAKSISMKWYRPPLDTLRSCVESVQQSSNPEISSIVYHASSVGGITDVLLNHFTAAVSPSSGPYPPVQQHQEEDSTSHNFTPPPPIKTPFPIAASINRFAATEGATGAITLRYFQMSTSKLYKTGWMPLNMSDGVTCHSKLIFPVLARRETPWVVIGSHNFTADCWAFAKQMLPRNFELSVFVPLSSVSIFDLFPHQTDFAENESVETIISGNARDASRFIFLSHKRDFFAALQQSDPRIRQERIDFILKSYLVKFENQQEDEGFYRPIFEKALVYHYSKFENEVHDDFGRH
jgi:hypothetical protein